MEKFQFDFSLSEKNVFGKKTTDVCKCFQTSETTEEKTEEVLTLQEVLTLRNFSSSFPLLPFSHFWNNVLIEYRKTGIQQIDLITSFHDMFQYLQLLSPLHLTTDMRKTIHETLLHTIKEGQAQYYHTTPLPLLPFLLSDGIKKMSVMSASSLEGFYGRYAVKGKVCTTVIEHARNHPQSYGYYLYQSKKIPNTSSATIFFDYNQSKVFYRGFLFFTEEVPPSAFVAILIILRKDMT
jgi:hypothetical protein